jgi:thiol-disulfide isomerase/thioredoxin
MEKLLKISSLISCVILLFISCENKTQVTLTQKEVLTSNTTVSLKLKKNERYILSYFDNFFKLKELVFSNPGDKDSTFFQTFPITMPTILSASMLFVKPNGENASANYYYLILPGDSMGFSLENSMLLKVDSLHNNRILDNSELYNYSNYSYLLNKEKAYQSNEDVEKHYNTFYTALKQINVDEHKKYDSLYKMKLIGFEYSSQLKWHSDILFYKIYFDYGSKRSKLPESVDANFRAELPNALKIINDPHAPITGNIMNIFYSILRVKLQSKNMDFSDPILLYNEALATELGPLKPGLLSSFLDWVPKNDPAYDSIIMDIKRTYKGTVYEKNIIELQQADSLLAKMKVNDLLIQLNNLKTSWERVINQKNDSLIFVDFWASWCAPCRAQLPLLDSLKMFFKDDPIEFISVNIDKEKNDWLLSSKAENKYLQRNNYHLIFYSKLGLLKKWSINSIPRYMIFKNGQALVTDFIPPTDADFKRELKKIVAHNK